MGHTGVCWAWCSSWQSCSRRWFAEYPLAIYVHYLECHAGILVFPHLLCSAGSPITLVALSGALCGFAREISSVPTSVLLTRFRPREIPIYKQKIALKAIFICISHKISLPLPRKGNQCCWAASQGLQPVSATHDFKCSSIRELLRGAMTDQINDREIFMKGIDYSYYYEQED